MALLGRRLDGLVSPEIRVLHRSLPAFRVCGWAGLALAAAVAVGLTAHRGLALWAMALVILTAVLTFLGLALATKIVTGRENLVYYYHEVAVLATTALLLRLAGQPAVPYLDVTILGVGAFLACGRVGCLMVGCCHGRPADWGVAYRREHADAGFTPALVGVRLLPVQAFESLLVLGIVGVGSALVWTGQPPGAALAWYVVAYGVARFALEFLRGDAVRRYLRGFSEAQWCSLALVGLVVAAELAGRLPLRWWHPAALAGLALAMTGVALRRRSPGRRDLLRPGHVLEIAAALDRLANRLPAEAERTPGPALGGAAVAVERTSRGLLISAGEADDGARRLRHYTLSAVSAAPTEARPLSDGDARDLARLILRLRHGGAGGELAHGSRGVYHILVLWT